ncbi:LysE family translocator [Rhodanobacter ginsengisoli]|uniref:LysE family translocator n=1 Tax=Rhodanobacter ginsengisoli TaxID=418646 RepID=A0ABW0QJT2_9GAMM
MLDPLLPLTGMLWVAALTPGPNNLVVLRTASRAGLRGALPAIVGIVLGGLLLLLLTALGTTTVFIAQPSLRWWIGTIGASYLGWLGTSLLAGSLRPAPAHATSGAGALPAGLPGLIGFQFLNPKSWVMVLTALASVPATGWRGYLPLAALFTVIPATCLLLWAALGTLLSRALARPRVRRRVDAGMGALLIASAGLLLIEH